ncbi:IgaA/UmoB family intracellular growth attenuator, partial [Escherichia coli]|uniref:IgaA/UmoB family intracellular growth attenuator n=1 Tax=Escherichia coli TaxID=562 RepID=UPI0035C04D65
MPLWRPRTARPPEHFVVFGRKIPRTPLLLLTMLGSAIYNGVQAWRRYQRHRTRMMEIQAY